MSEVQPTTGQFNFVQFSVPQFFYEESTINNGILNIDIKPSGVYVTDKFEYRLLVEFRAFEEQNKDSDIITMNSVSVFKFANGQSFDEIPEFFFQSALAITYPYIRSFITTFTAQANVKRVVLGLANMTVFGEELRENTQQINSTAQEGS